MRTPGSAASSPARSVLRATHREHRVRRGTAVPQRDQDPDSANLIDHAPVEVPLAPSRHHVLTATSAVRARSGRARESRGDPRAVDGARHRHRRHRIRAASAGTGVRRPHPRSETLAKTRAQPPGHHSGKRSDSHVVTWAVIHAKSSSWRFGQLRANGVLSVRDLARNDPEGTTSPSARTDGQHRRQLVEQCLEERDDLSRNRPVLQIVQYVVVSAAHCRRSSGTARWRQRTVRQRSAWSRTWLTRLSWPCPIRLGLGVLGGTTHAGRRTRINGLSAGWGEGAVVLAAALPGVW